MASVSSTITLVDQMSGALAGIESSINSMKDTLKSVAGEQTSIDNFKWDTFLKNAENAGKKIAQIGKEMSLALTAPLVMLGKEMYGDAVEYESAFAGVKKTTDATTEEYDALYSDLLRISETNPTGFVEAAGIMEMAGQLGVAKEELAGFTEAYIGLQESTNIQGETGAADIARFLNVTEKSTANIKRVGGVIVGLGNNFATTEQEILSMATRMGATADLAGFSSAEILAFSAALSSVGINAEAGGSAAGKLMKKMQLAAEVGGTAQERLAAAGYEYSSGLDFVNALSSMKKGDIAEIASALGVTVDAVQDLGNNWLALEQFSEVMGVTGEDFLSGWKDSPAQSLLKFFQGLGNLDAESGNSVLAQLSEMDITEIRLSNLVAALAGNSALFEAALAEAYKQYGTDPESNAMAEEVAKRYETTESQNEMLKNKLHNTMADFGDNLVRALTPLLETVTNILEKFNSLSEVNQSNIIKGLAIIAALGPGLTIVGGALKAIAAAMQLISGHGKGAANAVQDVVNAANNGTPTPTVPTGEVPTETVAETTGLSTGSMIVGGVTLAAVAYLFAKGIEYRNEHGALGSVEAIQKATQDNEALRNAFVEWVAVNNELNEAAEDVMNGKMGEEQFAEIAERQQKAIESFIGMEGSGVLQDLYNDWRYMNNMSLEDWYLPEDFLNWLKSFETLETPETPEVEIPEPEITVPEVETPEIDVPQAEVNVPETPQVEIPEPEITGTDADMIEIPVIPEFKVEGDVDLLKSQFAEFGITDPIVVDSLISLGISPTDFDMSGITTEVTQQLENTQDVTNAANNLGSAAVTAANNAMSPDMVVGLGFGFGFGVTNSIEQSTPQVTSAANAMSAGAVNSAAAVFGNGVVPAASTEMSSSAVNAAKGILSSGAGSAIGRNFMSGLAGGIRAGGSAAIAAAAGVANSVKSIVSSILQIHSPSRVAYWQGEMTMLGFANGISDGKTNILNTVRSIFDDVLDSWDEGTWDLISGFAETEAQALQDEFNNVEDGVKINSSDIKKIRSLAEREVINHFTTAEVKVEMNNTNTINSEADLDSLIAKLEDKVTERLEAVAEGVYT